MWLTLAAPSTAAHCREATHRRAAGDGPGPERAGSRRVARAAEAVGPHESAFRIHEENGRVVARYEQLALDDLSPGDVVIRVAWSGINYKDALAATGAGKILRKYPLVGGIDLAGVVESLERRSLQARRQGAGHGLRPVGDARRRLCGVRARAARTAVMPIPAGLDERSAMAIGTAGFTAALAIHRMEQNGQTPGARPSRRHGRDGRRRQLRHRHARGARLRSRAPSAARRRRRTI